MPSHPLPIVVRKQPNHKFTFPRYMILNGNIPDPVRGKAHLINMEKYGSRDSYPELHLIDAVCTLISRVGGVHDWQDIGETGDRHCVFVVQEMPNGRNILVVRYGSTMSVGVYSHS